VSDSNEIRIQVIYSAVHSRCDNRIARTHPKVFCRADLKSMLTEAKRKGIPETIKLYCHRCAESFDPTHIEIIEDGKIIVPETEIERFILAGHGLIST
jgi:hypothetical protein